MREYKGIIWTNHALERLRQRRIRQSDAWAAFSNPDQSRYAKSKGAWVFYRTWKGTRIEVVAKKEDGKWIVLSVWAKEALSKKERKSFWTKLFKLFSG